MVGYDFDSHNESIPVMEPGTLIYDGVGRWYRYLRAEDAAWAQGNLLEYASAALDEASNDRNGGNSLAGVVAGVAAAAVTDAYYGFVQVAGIGAFALVTTGNIAALDWLVPHASTDGAVDEFAITSTNPTNAEMKRAFAVFGVASAADSSTTQAAGSYLLKYLL